MSRQFLDCLKRERDIAIKAMLSGGQTAFSWISAANNSSRSVADQLQIARKQTWLPIAEKNLLIRYFIVLSCKSL